MTNIKNTFLVFLSSHLTMSVRDYYDFPKVITVRRIQTGGKEKPIPESKG